MRIRHNLGERDKVWEKKRLCACVNVCVCVCAPELEGEQVRVRVDGEER